MKYRLTPIVFLSALAVLIARPALAVCPVCTIAVGAGVGFSRWLGIDDTVTGLWIGGLTVSLIMWTINWLNKKNIYFKLRKIIVVIGYYAIIVVPLYFTGIMGHFYNKVWGIDKLLVGIITGSILFAASAIWYYYLKNHHGGRAYFPFQKVVMTVAPLIIFSFIFYWITK